MNPVDERFEEWSDALAEPEPQKSPWSTVFAVAQLLIVAALMGALVYYAAGGK
ncbi:hypothetical protein [Mycolicibacterium fortuitum]|uniref:hypothetical protein n=1 Tax=Mycolicibacterium fortuitum TaxID=1766 RepID=UPI0026139622|nr:hypothetical protein [Mycolicibacterium fortuitum]